MCKIKAPKADICFWTGFYNDEKVVSWASNKAYLDMNRTMTFKKDTKNLSQEDKNVIYEERKQWRDQGTEFIRKNILNLDKPFKAWHNDACQKLIEIYSKDQLVIRDGQKRTNKSAHLTYGQAQKWLNMTLKYLWLLNRLGLIEDKKIRSWINKHEKSFHVPLDSYILKYVAKQDKNKKSKFSDENNNSLGDSDFSKFWNDFGSAWSKIADEKRYYEYQEKLADAIARENMGCYPLEWELVHWHKAIKYYD